MKEWIDWLFSVGDYDPQKVFGGVARAAQWPKIRAAHLLKEPICQICGGKLKLTVHHIRPFHIHPELELDDTNLITLCEGAGSGNHHLTFGHWGNYATKWNPTIRSEITLWLGRFTAKTMSVDNDVADPNGAVE